MTLAPIRYVGANGDCTIGDSAIGTNGAIGDSAICEISAIGAINTSGSNGAIAICTIGTMAIGANGSNYKNGTIANGAIGTIGTIAKVPLALTDLIDANVIERHCHLNGAIGGHWRQRWCH